MKPPKTVVKSVLIHKWEFLHHHAVRLYENGWIFACDVCGEINLDERSRENDEYLKDLDKVNRIGVELGFEDDDFGRRETGRELCPDCWKSGGKARPGKPSPHVAARGTKACPSCAGKTAVPCKRCDGSGWIGCLSCEAVGGALCARCKGEGEIDEECRPCSGTGVRQDFFGQLFRHKCPDCKGRRTKTTSCPDCDAKGRHDDCARCAGRGETDCPICSGKAELPCPECKGYGRPVP